MMKSHGVGAINRSKMGREQEFSAGGLSNQDEMTLLLARKGEVSRGQAFQAARRLKLQEFEWKDPQTGKTGRYHTRMAGEAPSRPAGGISVPKGMKESDIYRDVDYENELRKVDKEYQQGLRNIEADSALRSLRDQEAYEQQESLRGEAAQHLAALRQQEKEQRAAESLGDLADYERREASESALGELADYERREREQSKMGELHRDVANYENDLRMAHLVGSAKPLERVYPEAALPLTRLGRLLGGSAPKSRQEPRLGNLDKLRPRKRVEPYSQGGSVAGASRGDGVAQRGKTRGIYHLSNGGFLSSLQQPVFLSEADRERLAAMDRQREEFNAAVERYNQSMMGTGGYNDQLNAYIAQLRDIEANPYETVKPVKATAASRLGYFYELPSGVTGSAAQLEGQGYTVSGTGPGAMISVPRALPTAPTKLEAPKAPFTEEAFTKAQEEAQTRAREAAGQRAVAIQAFEDPSRFGLSGFSGISSLGSRSFAKGGEVKEEGTKASRMMKELGFTKPPKGKTLADEPSKLTPEILAYSLRAQSEGNKDKDLRRGSFSVPGALAVKRFEEGGEARSEKSESKEDDLTFFARSMTPPGTPEHERLRADTAGFIKRMDDASVMATASRMTGLPFDSPTQARLMLEKMLGEGVSVSAGVSGVGKTLPERVVGYDVGARFPALGGQMSVGATIPRGPGSPAFNLGYRRQFSEGGDVSRETSESRSYLDELDAKDDPIRSGKPLRSRTRKPATQAENKALSQAVLQFFTDYLKPVRVNEVDNYLTPLLQDYGMGLLRMRDGGEVNKHDAFIAKHQAGGEAKSDEPQVTGISRLMDFIAQRLSPESLPKAGRTVLESVQGKKDPITESSFTKDELEVLRRLTSTDKGRVGYEDYSRLAEQLRQEGQGSSDATPSLFSLGSPVGNVRNTLGRFTYTRDPQGNVVVIDKYDFNPPVSGQTQESRTSDYGVFGPYNVIREYAGQKLPPGKGRDVRINLANPVPQTNGSTRNKQ